MAILLLFIWFVAYSLDRVSFHTYLLERIDLLLFTVRNVQRLFFLCPYTFCSSARGGFFQVVFHETRNASHELSVPSVGPPFFVSLV